jgi:hypothetical protein
VSLVKFYRESSQAKVRQRDKGDKIKLGNNPVFNMRKKAYLVYCHCVSITVIGVVKKLSILCISVSELSSIYLKCCVNACTRKLFFFFPDEQTKPF